MISPLVWSIYQQNISKRLRIDKKDVNSEWFCRWVREQVELARYFFRQGKAYIHSLAVLRCKLAGVWYCARFECILNAIEQDGYRLRSKYCERHALKTWLEMFRLGFVVTWKHLAGRIRSWIAPAPSNRMEYFQ